jgi:hypothetical protein
MMHKSPTTRPRFPIEGGLTIHQAADYCNMSYVAFRKQIQRNGLSTDLKFGREPIWTTAYLDRFLAIRLSPRRPVLSTALPDIAKVLAGKRGAALEAQLVGLLQTGLDTGKLVFNDEEAPVMTSFRYLLSKDAGDWQPVWKKARRS